MDKKEIMLYAITIISLMVFICIVFSAISKSPNISNQKFMGLTGNAIIDFGNNFKVGDNVTGDIILNQKKQDVYGMILLTKDSKEMVTRTFNLKDVMTKDKNPGENIVKIENLINYKFEENGNYELLFSILDLNINIKENIVVE